MTDQQMTTGVEASRFRPAEPAPTPRKYARAIDCTSRARVAPAIEPEPPDPEPALPAPRKASDR